MQRFALMAMIDPLEQQLVEVVTAVRSSVDQCTGPPVTLVLEKKPKNEESEEPENE